MRRVKNGIGRGRDYDNLVGSLPAHSVTKLAIELMRRAFEAGYTGTTSPSNEQFAVCARAVGNLPPADAVRHRQLFSRARELMLSGVLTPLVALLVTERLESTMREIVALGQARNAVKWQRRLCETSAMDLRTQGVTELAVEHEETEKALAAQLESLNARWSAALDRLRAIGVDDPLRELRETGEELEAVLRVSVLSEQQRNIMLALAEVRSWAGSKGLDHAAQFDALLTE